MNRSGPSVPHWGLETHLYPSGPEDSTWGGRCRGGRQIRPRANGGWVRPVGSVRCTSKERGKGKRVLGRSPAVRPLVAVVGEVEGTTAPLTGLVAHSTVVVSVGASFPLQPVVTVGRTHGWGRGLGRDGPGPTLWVVGTGIGPGRLSSFTQSVETPNRSNIYACPSW